MKLYSDFARPRAYQIAGDVVALVVVILGIVVGVTLHGLIDAFKGIGVNVAASGTSFAKQMAAIGDQLGGVPLIGGGIKSPFVAASSAGTTLARAGVDYQTGVERLASFVGWTVALLVLLVVLVGWVRPRLVGAVRRGIVARLVRRSPDLDLLAFRALANRPAAEVVRLDPEAVAGWRRGDTDVIRALAALELKDAGIKLQDGAGAASRVRSTIDAAQRRPR